MLDIDRQQFTDLVLQKMGAKAQAFIQTDKLRDAKLALERLDLECVKNHLTDDQTGEHGLYEMRNDLPNLKNWSDARLDAFTPAE